MTMRTWMSVLSAAGLLALGSACVVTETSGSGGSGGAGQGGMSSSSSSSGSTGTAGGGGQGGSAAACFKTCDETLTATTPVDKIEICADASDAVKTAFADVSKCICAKTADGGVCGDVCNDGADAKTNTCAGATPTDACNTCINNPMAGCQTQITACTSAK